MQAGASRPTNLLQRCLTKAVTLDVQACARLFNVREKRRERLGRCRQVKTKGAAVSLNELAARKRVSRSECDERCGVVLQ